MKLSEMRTEVTPQKINKIVESRFGFSIDYDNMTYAKAERLTKALGENITAIKQSFGSHTAEKNPKYMELMLVKEGLAKWLSSEQGLFESEMGKSEAVLAAKDITDSIQDMLEKVSKIQNEQLPALIDTIRDQISAEQAETFKNAIRPVLASLYDAMTSGRDQADNASRALAGEQVSGGDMALGGDEFGGEEPGADLGAAPGEESDFDQDLGAPPEDDEFAATDAAAGGSADLGRGRR